MERNDSLKLFLSIPKSTVQLIAGKGDQTEEDDINGIDDEQLPSDNGNIATSWNQQNGNGYSLIVKLAIQVTSFQLLSNLISLLLTSYFYPSLIYIHTYIHTYDSTLSY